MRVIAGQARGMMLHAPSDDSIRPTSDRVREALFNILGPWLSDGRFLDAFSGTGANGIEALSRGAREVVFVDSTRNALGLVRNNLVKTKLATGAVLLEAVLPKDGDRVHGPFDVIFADPPYDYQDYAGLLECFARDGFLAEDGIIVIEHIKSLDLPESVGTLEQTRRKKYGKSCLSFYRFQN